jgi:hypothetical protein
MDARHPTLPAAPALADLAATAVPLETHSRTTSMPYVSPRRALAALATATLAACSGATPSTQPNGLAIEVAPLDLPGLVEATYQLTVKNAGGETVWTKGPLASTTYGNGQGALSYIGTCDADGGLHTVELVLLSLTDTTGPMLSPRDYVNPTVAPSGAVTPIVIRDVPCTENADTRVTFDLTIMRAARQGFFDFAVTFDDIFCSAKLDCRPELLHDAQGNRGPTAVLAFACTAGQGESTELYLSDLVLRCTDANGTTTTTLPVASAEPGQQGPQGPSIYQWAVYQDREFLDADGNSPLEKCYWNHALGLDVATLANKSCTLTASGAASETPLVLGPGGYTLPQDGAYPFIRWNAEVLTTSGTLCQNLALNTSNGAVQTEYVLHDTAAGDLPRLTAHMSCGTPTGLACATALGPITVSASTDGFTLASADGSVATRAFTLPEGYTLGASCCAPGCCQ